MEALPAFDLAKGWYRLWYKFSDFTGEDQRPGQRRLHSESDDEREGLEVLVTAAFRLPAVSSTFLL